MAGKQAKILTDLDIERLLILTRKSRYPLRDRCLVLLSVKAGMRAGEIAKITWPMVLEPTGKIGPSIELRDNAAKMGSGRRIPLHPDLRICLERLKRASPFSSPFRMPTYPTNFLMLSAISDMNPASQLESSSEAQIWG